MTNPITHVTGAALGDAVAQTPDIPLGNLFICETSD